MNLWNTLLPVLIFLIIGAGANAQQLELVEDINLDGFAFSQFSSRPSGFTEFNNKLYFSAKGPKTGQELFSYDGTDVELVADIHQGADASVLNYNSSNPANLLVFNNKLYFIATNDGDSAYLYSYDGISAPSIAVNLHTAANYSNYVELIEYNNKLHYTTYDANTDVYSLWEYNGINSPSLVHSESSISVGYNFRAFVVFNGDLYFFKSGTMASNSTYYKYDGINPPSAVSSLSNFIAFGNESIVYNNEIYFNAHPSAGSTGNELYSYDGVNPPVLISDINPGTGSSAISELTIFNNKLYFSAYGVGSANRELWSYDGTTASEVADINTAGGSSPIYLKVFNNKLYFTATDGITGYELYEYNGSTTPSIVVDLVTGADSGFPKFITEFQNELIFAATDGTVAEEVYKYDGINISLVANIFDGSNGSTPRHFTEYKNKMYFSAYADSDIGDELYSYDGVSVNLVADIDTAHAGWLGTASSSQPRNLFVFNDLLYFRATDGSGFKNWKYDGINPPSIDTVLPNNAGNFIVFDSTLYFSAYDVTYGTELWQYDGTTASMVYDINPGTTNGVSYPHFTIFDDKLIFSANDGVNGLEVWEYDGMNTPTILADINAGSGNSNPGGFKEHNGKLYFSAQADTIAGVELWMYDGNNSPSLEADILPGVAANGYPNSSYPSFINVVNNKLVFVATDTLSNRDLWEYDFVNPPVKITNYNPSNSSNQFSKLTEIDGKIYFWADEGAGLGYELYKYDGIVAPTMFDEVNSGIGHSMASNPSNFLKYDGYIYLAANDGVLGYVFSGELYRVQADSGLSIKPLIMDVDELNVYPNPVQNQLFMELGEDQIMELSIFDLSGRLVKSMTNYTSKSVNVSNLEQGMYILKIRTRKGLSTAQFIKQ